VGEKSHSRIVDRLAQFSELGRHCSRSLTACWASEPMPKTWCRTRSLCALADCSYRGDPVAQSYLMTVVGRLSLDSLKAAYRKRERYIGPWLPEPLVDEPAPAAAELAESLSLAFLHVLEKRSWRPRSRIAGNWLPDRVSACARTGRAIVSNLAIMKQFYAGFYYRVPVATPQAWRRCLRRMWFCMRTEAAAPKPP
jgi:hypothetical protein